MQLALILIIILSAIATFGLNWDDTEILETKNWRWALYKRRIQRWFIYKAWQHYVPNLRWFGLLIVTIVTFFVVRKYLPDFKITEIAKLKHPADATLILALIGAPIAYVIWWFRDANARQQIENQRKDVNLKDFQRLAEWAAGMHLPENKVTTSEKEIKAKTNASNETLISTETSAIPTSTVIYTPSRREGAASLQIAAIYQLQAFLQGEYGRYFQRPAFQLLKSIWLALVSQNLAELEELMQEERNFAIEQDKKIFKETLSQWKSNLEVTMASPIGEAITVALGAQQGWLLRTHQADLPNSVLTGYNCQLAALRQPIELDGLNLTGIKLQGADLRCAQLQGADLSYARLQGAELNNAQLQGAYLFSAQLQGAELINSKLQGTDLQDAYLQDTFLYGAQLQGADLFGAHLQGAYVHGAQLQGADLFGVQLQGAVFTNAQLYGTNFTNIEINEQTKFYTCETDSNIKVFIDNHHVDSDERYIDIEATFKLRQQLKRQGLILPDVLYQQLFAKASKYNFINQHDKLEKRYDVGLLSSFS